MLNKKEQIELAAKLLKIPVLQAEENMLQLDEDKAIYVGIHEKGGASLIVGNDGQVLYANSSVGFSMHLDEYRKGRRTPLEAFNRGESK